MFRVRHVLILMALLVLASGATAQTVSFIDENGAPASSYVDGGVVYLQVTDATNAGNQYVDVMLTTVNAADSETVTLLETSSFSGVFAGSIGMQSEIATVSDGRLQTQSVLSPFARDTLNVDYNFGAATASIGLVGSTVRFVDRNGYDTAVFAEMEDGFVEVIDYLINDPYTIDSFSLSVYDAAFGYGNGPYVTMQETGFDTGVFEGSFSGSAFPNGTAVETLHNDFEGGTSSLANATVAALRFRFVNADGEPVNEIFEADRAYTQAINPSSGSLVADIDSQLTGDVDSVYLQEDLAKPGVMSSSITLSTESLAQSSDFLLQTWQDGVGGPDTVTLSYDTGLDLIQESVTTVPSRTTLIDVNGNEATAYAVGGQVIVRVRDHNADVSGAIDTTTVQLTTASLDLEDVTLQETGYSTGIFEATLPIGNFGSINDGVVNTSIPDTITATHDDFVGLSSSTDDAPVYDQGVFLITDELANGSLKVRLYEPSAFPPVTVYLETRFSQDFESVDMNEVEPGIYEGTIDVGYAPANTYDGTVQAYNETISPYRADEITARWSPFFDTITFPGVEWTFLDADGHEVADYATGETLYVRLRAPAANSNPSGVESVTVNATALSAYINDTETFSLTETGEDTGVFEGSLPSDAQGFGSPEDGFLDTSYRVTALLSYEGSGGQKYTAEQLFDDFRAEFIDANGVPTDTFVLGENITVRVYAPSSNDPGFVDTYWVNVTTSLGGDQESVTVVETGVDTGIFEGFVPMEYFSNTGTYSGVIGFTDQPGPPYEADLLEIYNGGDRPPFDTAGVVTSRVRLTDVDGNDRETFAIGETIYIEVNDIQSPLNPLDVTLTSPDDTETLTLTDNGGGLYKGSIVLSGNTSSSYDGTFHIFSAGTIDATYNNFNYYQPSSDQAEVVEAMVFFIDENGNVTDQVPEGGLARVRILDFAQASSSQPNTLGVQMSSINAASNEYFTVEEVTPLTGIFEGSVQLASPYQTGLSAGNSGPPNYDPETLVVAYDSPFGQLYNAFATVYAARVDFLDLFGNSTTAYALGDTVYVRVIDYVQNDPSQIDSISFILDSLTSGDNEDITLTETGADTGVFTGSIPTVSSSGLNDGQLTVQLGEEIVGSHQNYSDPFTTQARANINGSGLYFVDAAGQQVAAYQEGSYVYLRVNDVGASGSVTVSLSSALAADLEDVTLNETTTGVFVGSIQLTTQPAISYNGTLETSRNGSDFDTLTAQYNDTNGGTSQATAQTKGPDLYFVDAFGNSVESYALGEIVYFRAEAPTFNLSPGTFDQVNIRLYSVATNDQEDFQVYETGVDTGIFEGSMPLGSGGQLGNDGILQASSGEQIEVTLLDDFLESQATDTANITDYGLVFIDENGMPIDDIVEGGTLYIRAINASANWDQYAVDQTGVYLTSNYGGGASYYDLFETGPNTNVFEGSVRLATLYNPGFPTANSGPPSYLPDTITVDDGNGTIDTVTTVSARAFFIDTFGRVTTTFAVGETVAVRIIDHTLDDPGYTDQLYVDLTSSSGDTESLDLFETGLNTGTFEGVVPNAISSSTSDGILTVNNGDTLTVTHTNTSDSVPAVAEANVISSNVFFIDENGGLATSYLEGARAYIRVIDNDYAGDGTVETLNVTVVTEAGKDSETVTLTETGPATRTFEGSIALGVQTTSFDDGVLTVQQIQLSPGAPVQKEVLTVTYNDNYSNTSTATATTLGGLVSFIDAYGSPTSVYADGDTVYVRVVSYTSNTSPTSLNTTGVELEGIASDDTEQLTLYETGLDTNVFEGSIPLGAGGSQFDNDGVFQVSSGETIEARHNDYFGYDPIVAQASIVDVTVDFLDENGEPTDEVLAGSLVRIRMFNVNANMDSAQADQTSVYVSSLYAAGSTYADVFETGPNTSVFEGTVQLETFYVSGLATGDSGFPDYKDEVLTADDGNGNTATATVAGSRVLFIDAFGNATETYPLGEAVSLRVIDYTLDPTTLDNMSVDVTTDSGDLEYVSVTETSVGSGILEGSIATALSTASQDGALTGDVGEVLNAAYFGGSSLAINAEPATVVNASINFIDANGQPATVYRVGGTAYVEVVDGNLSQFTDYVSVTISSALTGDQETFDVTRSTPSNDPFVGSIDLGTNAAVQGDGILQTSEYLEEPGAPLVVDTLTVTYDDSNNIWNDTASTTGSDVAFINAYGATVTSYAFGETVYFRVLAPAANSSASAFDSTGVELYSLANGDSEQLTIWETGFDTDVFEGSISLAYDNPSTNDGVLQGSLDDILEVRHNDFFGYTQAFAQALTADKSAFFIDGPGGAPVDEVLLGDLVWIRLINPNANSDSQTAELTSVWVTSQNGADGRNADLTETGPNTSVFEGTIQLQTSFKSGLATQDSGSPLYEPEIISIDDSGTILDSASVIDTRTFFINAAGQVTSSFVEGETVGVRVLDHSQDPSGVDSVTGQVIASSSGDNETVTVTETGLDTGIFEVSIDASALVTLQNDGVLTAAAGNTLQMEFEPGQPPRTSSASATVGYAAIDFIDANGNIASAYMEGSTAYLRVTDQSVAGSGTVTANLTTTLAGDFEPVNLTETEASSGIFEGSIALGVQAAVPSDGVLQTTFYYQEPGAPTLWDTLNAVYDDTFGSSATATATTVGSTTTFIDADGNDTDGYGPGQNVYIKVVDMAVSGSGSTGAVVTSDGNFGDVENVTLTETEPGVFVGSITFALGSFTQYDGVLQAQAGERLDVSHNDASGYTESTDQATARAAAIFIVGADGEPTADLQEGGYVNIRLFAEGTPGSVDYLQAEATTLNAVGFEYVDLMETGPSTNVFEGSIRLQGSNGVGVLPIANGGAPGYSPEQVTVSYDPFIEAPATATANVTIGSVTAFLDAAGNETTVMVQEDLVRVRVTDYNLDNPAQLDTAQVTVQSFNGGSQSDSETFTLLETGTSTGIFEGFVEGGVDASVDNGILRVVSPETLTASHTNANDPSTSTANATVETSAAFFIDEAGNITSTFLQDSSAGLRVIDHTATGFVNVTVQTVGSSDVETFDINETNVAGIFEGSINLVTGSSITENDLLETSSPDTLNLTYGSASAQATTVASQLRITDVFGQTPPALGLDETLFVEVTDYAAGSGGIVDTINVQAAGQDSGEVETLTLTETGPDSNVYTGSVYLELGATGVNDGRLSVVHNSDDLVTVTYGSESASVGVLQGRSLWIGADGQPTNEAIAGDSILLWSVDHFSNFSSGSVNNSSQTRVWTRYSGDDEYYNLTETANDSAVFEGMVDLVYVASRGTATPFDNLTQVTTSGSPDYSPEEVTADYGLGTSISVLTVLPARVSFVDASGAVTNNYAQGSIIRVRIEDAGLAMNPSVTISAALGDSETINLTETGVGTGVYEGSLPSSSAAGTSEDGVLNAAYGERITTTFGASAGINVTAEALINGFNAPSVAITAPADGASSTESVSVTFTGTASDIEDGDLAAFIAWTSSLDGSIGTGATFDTSALSVGAHTITATVTDSSGESAAASITYTVNANVAPNVAITAPADNSVVTQGDNVTFTGTASDNEDGDLTASISWSSSLDGALGTGGSVATSALSLGSHTITAEVTDSNSATSSTTITLTINAAPSVSITAPADGGSSTEDNVVTFTGTASDSEDGDLTASIAWTSSIDGSIGTGATFNTSALTVGAHTITATVTDSNSANATDTITYTVNANVAPNVAITAPADNSVVTQGDNVTFTGTASDNEDGDLTASISWSSSLDGALGTGGSVATSALSLGSHTITAEVTDSNSATSSTTITLTINAAPSVSITAPADGSSSTEGNVVTFTGTASDSEDGDLTASIAWTSSIDGSIGTGATFNTSALSVGAHTITATVTDSNSANATDTITYTVNANVAPNVAITAPADNSVVTQGDNVTFTGTASDNEDGDLTASISWSSSLDGALGTGGSVATSALSLGSHTITAEVTDSNSATSSTTITLTINAAPSVSITAPADGGSSTEGNVVTFTGTASDSEDGDLTASIAWTSSIDGSIGTGATFNTSALSVGAHTITASVTDSNSANATDTITYTVNANVAPNVAITAPADNSVVTQGDNVTFTGTASDNEDGDLTASISWSSSLDGALGTGGSVATSALSLGSHTITAEVTDSNSATSSTTITLTINAAPSVSITAPADGGSSTEGNVVTFTGTASDSEDGDLTASIAWTSSIDGSIGTGATFNTSALTVGAHTITATVTDSNSANATDTITYTVNANVAPNVAITAPADNSVVTQGDNVTFTGTASDNEDGDLTASISWSSSLDGTLGTGGSVATSALSLGSHTITAEVTDSNSATSSTTITLTINAAPSVSITAPADGGSSTEGNVVTFTGTASDSEDGDLTASIAWTSSIDGSIGTGATFNTSALSVGAHTITATVTDSNSANATDSITYTVNANVAPNVAITAPAGNSVVTQGDNVTFTGTASDNEDGDLTASISWSSSLDGALGTGGSVATSALSLGSHTITAEVTDSNSATSSTTITLTINATPSVSITAPVDGGSSTEGNVVTFTGTASDSEDGDLTASIAWTSSIDGSIGTGATFNTSALTVGAHTITATVTDSNSANATDSITYTVNANVAPNVAITAPADNSVVTQGDNVTFTGTASDNEDGDLTASISWSSSLDGALGTGGSVATSSLSLGSHTITAEVTDSNSATSSTTITLTINAAPSVSITAPADGGSSTEGNVVTFTGTASDSEDGDLTASIAWTSSIDGSIGTGATFNTSALSVGAHTITASVTDSNSANASDSITYTVNANVAPNVAITAPADNSVVTQGDNVTFTGTASDNEDGDLTASISWSSSLDGALGTGGSVATSSLSLGSHTITAEVTDSNSATSSTTITLTINAAPSVSITAPADGGSSTEGNVVTFTGTASDSEDGDLTASIVWTSSIDGSIGTGATFNTSALTVGAHTITASVTDSNSANATDSITYTVNANVAPNVAITAPADNSVVTQGDNVTFTGTASDNEDGDLTASISWSSSLDGALGTGGSVATSSLSLGSHTITAEVTDSNSATSSTTITLTINAAPSVSITAPADGGSSTEGNVVTFTGTASDSEDGDLTASIAWTSSIDGSIGTGATFNTSALSVGAHTITASVTDSNSANATDSITYTVNANVAPNVAITAPADGASATEGTSVTFTGTASDNEDGDLTASIAWTSSIDGSIGTGATLNTSTLTVGTHTITASVTDSNSVTATDSITYTVNANVAPNVAITAPANNSVVTQGNNVTFTGTASDNEDGDLTASISWSSSLDGALGTGGSVATSTLSVGTHTITASVTDSHGAPDSAAITIRINAAPAVLITGPTDGSQFGTGDQIDFTATASDPENGDLTGVVSWTSNIDGALGSGSPLAVTTLSAGTHLITATVTDLDGASAIAQITVIVKVPITVTFTSQDAYDGWVREQNETANVGGRTNDNNLRMGDNRSDRQFKGIASFDTSSLPDGATIRSATIRIQRRSTNGTSPFVTHGDLKADIVTGTFGLLDLENSDFEATATAEGIAIFTEALENGDWSEGPLDSDGRDALNLTGITQFRLAFDLDDNDDGNNDYIQYYTSDDNNTTRHPQLVIEYLD